MFTIKAWRYIMPLYFSMFQATIMSIVRALINVGYIPFPEILSNIFIGATVAYIAGVAFPIIKLANAVAELFKANKGTFLYAALTTFVFAMYYTMIFSFLFTALAIGFSTYYLSTVFRGIPLSFAIGYIVAFAITPIVLKLTKLTCSKSST